MSDTLTRDLQEFHQAGRYVQIVQALRQYKLAKLPAGIDVPIVIEAIIHIFRSSDEDAMGQATGLMIHLEREGYLNRNDLDKIFNELGEVFLNVKGEIPFFISSALMFSRNKGVPQNLISLYLRAKSQDARSELADEIGAFHKEQGLLVLLDNLCSQQIIRDDYILAMLRKYSLLENIDLESEECDAIASAMLDYLGISGPKIDNSDDEIKFERESRNRTSAARILVVLNRNLNTSEESRARMQSSGDLIVTYSCADRMYDAFVEIPLSRYLSGGIN